MDTDDTPKIYDLAVSFAGEQRGYVVQCVEACRELGLKVFYDKDMNNDWWGSNFIRKQRSVYSSQTKFFVPFISTEYLNKPIPMDEFESAMMTSVKQGEGYILPVLMDDTPIPAELLHPHIHYLRAKDFAPEQLAQELNRKVRGVISGQHVPKQIGEVLESALKVRLPKVVAADWSRYASLDETFLYIGRRFQEGGQQLRTQHFITTVRVSDDLINVRVERGGETVAALDLEKGRQMGDDKITWSVGRNRSMSSGFNGWAMPRFDVQRGESGIELSDFGIHAGGTSDSELLTNEEFFTYLWDLIVQQIER